MIKLNNRIIKTNCMRLTSSKSGNILGELVVDRVRIADRVVV